jgi:hypothetical protein
MGEKSGCAVMLHVAAVLTTAITFLPGSALADNGTISGIIYDQYASSIDVSGKGGAYYVITSKGSIGTVCGRGRFIVDPNTDSGKVMITELQLARSLYRTVTLTVEKTAQGSPRCTPDGSDVVVDRI